MGLDPENPIEGWPCEVCWGEDKPFGRFLTPEQIFVEFTGVQLAACGQHPDHTCPNSPINGKYVLQQWSAGLPCSWKYEDSHIRIIYEAKSGAFDHSNLYSYDLESDCTDKRNFWGYHGDNDPPICSTYFTNRYGPELWLCGGGGTGVIT